MVKRYFIQISAFLYFTVFLSLVYIFLNPRIFEFIFTQPLYIYSILFFLCSIIFEMIIISKGTFKLPSLFLLIIFLTYPLFGSLGFKQYFETNNEFFGRALPSFAFPTFLWYFGTLCFFGGVLLSYILLPKFKYRKLVVFNSKRIQLLLIFSVLISIFGTAISLYKIGYIPIFKGDILNSRVNYYNIIGRFITRLNLWIVAGLMSSILFILTKNKKRYIYLFLTIISAFMTTLFGQRTNFVIIFSIFGLVYFKFTEIKKLKILIIGSSFFLMIFILILLANYRNSGTSQKPGPENIMMDTFYEWRYYSIVSNEAKASSNYLGWSILSGPFILFVPNQIIVFLGYDKKDLIQEYSAVYYYGKEFNESYGIRITPIGEAYAAFGISGVFFYMFFYGIFFGVLENIYLTLEKPDARLFIICFLMSVMLYLPISTVSNILEPYYYTGPFVIAYYIFGTKKIEF